MQNFLHSESQNFPYTSSELSVIGKTADPNLWLFRDGHKVSAVLVPNLLEKFNLGSLVSAKKVHCRRDNQVAKLNLSTSLLLLLQVDADILEKFLKQGFSEATHCFHNL